MRAPVLVFALMACVAACASRSDDGGEDETTTTQPAKPTNTKTGQTSTTTTPPAGTTPGATQPLPTVEPDVDFETVTMGWNGTTRSYILGRPRGYDAKRAYPLVIAFHGNPSSKETLRKQAPFELGSKRDAFLVYPDADGGGWDLLTPAATNKDMEWIRQLPGEIAKTANIDRTRVFGFGFSGGAFFVSEMACTFGDVFRAISVNSGGAPDGSQTGWEKKQNGCYTCPGGPVPTLVVHGMNDGTVVKASGVFAATCAAETNSCATNDVKTATTPSPCQKADSCAAPTELCLIQGLGHQPWAQTYAKSWSFFQSAP